MAVCRIEAVRGFWRRNRDEGIAQGLILVRPKRSLVLKTVHPVTASYPKAVQA